MTAPHVPSSPVEGEKTAHTAGDWRTFNGTDIYPDDDDTEGTRHIADFSMSDTITYEEQRANALLGAAAPAMYRALKAFIAAEKQTGNSAISVFAYDKAMEAAYDLAVAAIRRAEGRAARKDGA